MKEVDRWMELEEGESSTIAKFKYQADTETLTIIFASGDTYHHFEVPGDVAVGLREAESKGKFFAKSVRNKYEFAKVLPPVKLKEFTDG